ncbi:hypothetical protein ACFL2Q_19175 [Thermodesulfobacteriota bacterium]
MIQGKQSSKQRASTQGALTERASRERTLDKRTGPTLARGVFSASLLFIVLLTVAGALFTFVGFTWAKESSSEPVWQMPGRLSIYDLQMGPAVLKGTKWNFVGNMRTFKASEYGNRLTIMVRFSYNGSKAEIPLKFVIKLPESRQYEETVVLRKRRGSYAYTLTIHNPVECVGTGWIYIYYGFSMVDGLDFSIVPGS